MPQSHLMTTAEVAAYLRVKERKVYDLVASNQIPCTRVTGKLLFPKPLIDLWISSGTAGIDKASALVARPTIAAGSHDPLMDWALRESGAKIATLFDGSLDGLDRFLKREALFAGIHVFDPETRDYNRHLLEQAATSIAGIVMIEWAVRNQGLILPPGNPKGVTDLPDLASKGLVFQSRQAEAGSQLLFESLLRAAGIAPEDVERTRTVAREETDAATGVLDGAADVAFGIEAVARRFRLDFIPLHEERYDIVIDRHDYFEPPFQMLLGFAHTERFRENAEALGGYDIRGLGRVVLNAG